MTLIKSISGIRGTIGGQVNEGLSPFDVIKFSAAFGAWVLKVSDNNIAVVGRDARISGEMVSNLVIGALQSVGLSVIDLGLSTTPTTSHAIPWNKAGGGIMITASHNPIEWNALKLFNEKGELLNAENGSEVLFMADALSFEFAKIKGIGGYKKEETAIGNHINDILKLPLVDTNAIREKKFRIVTDCVNSTGGITVPRLLKSLGVAEVIEMFSDPNGKFPHNPEPLPEHLKAISNEVKHRKADLGIVVDPDVDRLALVCEDGNMFGEEYTLVSIADYVLKHRKGAAVSNLSSSRALKDVTENYKASYYASAVGEVNVVRKMKDNKAVIGGEGNGGIIYPDLHFCRDALVGIALFLSHLAKCNMRISLLRKSYPNYFMSKSKIVFNKGDDVELILKIIAEKYSANEVNKEDGVKIDFEDEWVHLRKSNTEPVIRVYAESRSQIAADDLTKKMIKDIRINLK